MKILFFNEFTRQYGGVDSVYEQEVIALKNRGINIKTFNFFNNELFVDSLFNKSKILLFSLNGSLKLRNFQNMINEFNPDIIHFHNIYQLFRSPIWANIDFKTAKIIIHLHNFYPFCLNSFFYSKHEICNRCYVKNSWIPGIKKKCYNRSTLRTLYVSIKRDKPLSWIKSQNIVSQYIAVSKFIAQKYIEYGLNHEKVKILYNPVRLMNKPLNHSVGKYVLYIGNVVIAKGVEVFCQVAKVNPDIPFLICGDGEDLNYIKEKFKNINNLQYKNYVTGSEKIKIFNNSRFLFFPTQCWESFGLTVIESFNFGKPVVSSGFGAHSELIINNKTGYINNENSIDSYSRIIRDLWFIMENKNKFREDCINYSNQYGIDNHIDKLLEIYKLSIEKNEI